MMRVDDIARMFGERAWKMPKAGDVVIWRAGELKVFAVRDEICKVQAKVEHMGNVLTKGANSQRSKGNVKTCSHATFSAFEGASAKDSIVGMLI